MKKTLIYSILSVFFLTVSCESYTEDLNTDPNNFASAPPELIIGKAQLGWMQLLTSNSARYAGIFMNHFTGEDRQYLTVNAYSTTAADYNDTWDDAFVDGVAQAQLTKVLADDSGNLVLSGIARIVEASVLGEMAALFGDIPYTEANDIENFPTPAYDSQASVLAAVQALLDQAIANVGSAAVGTPDPNDSGVAAGNRLSSTSTWAQVAHSLKARYYLIAKDYPNALISARQGINTPSGSLVTLHTTSLNTENLYYQFMVDERDGYLGATDSHLVHLLNGTVPRLINTPGDADRFTFYFSVNGSGHAPNVSTTGVFAETASMNIISYEEVKLIEAEAANRTGDAGDVTAFNEIRESLFLEHNSSTNFDITHSSGSVGSDFTITITSQPTNGIAEVNDNGTDADASDDYIVFTPSAQIMGTEVIEYEICDNNMPVVCETNSINVTSGFPDTTSASGSAALLAEILEEKYITLIGELQPFHDIRRTNNLLNVPPKTGSIIPQRFIYPQAEVDTNPNVPSPLPDLFTVTPVNQ